MGGKKPAAGGGEGSKKAQGQARKADAAAAKADAAAAKAAAAEAAEWNKGAKSNAKQEAEAAKKAEAARKKAEKEALMAEEEKNLPTRPGPKNAKTAPKKTRGLDLSQLDDDGGSKKQPGIVATNIDDALDALALDEGGAAGSKIDRHPERRRKAAYAAFEERRLREMEADGTGAGLRLNQRKERLRKEFEKSPENPMNQVSVSYDATKEEIEALKQGENAGLKQACPTGVFVSLTPGDPSLWSGVMFVRKGPYATAVLRFQVSFPDTFPSLPPLVTFSTDLFHPLITPLTTYMYTTDIHATGTVSATDDERLPPGGFSLRHGFPGWFGRRGGSRSRQVSGQSQTRTPQSSPPPASASAPGSASASSVGEALASHARRRDVSTYEVLRYIRSTFDDAEVLDSVPLEAAGNPGAWHAWRTRQKRQAVGGGGAPAGPALGAGKALPPEPKGAEGAGAARRPGEWDWEGVWEERVRKGIAASLSEAVLYGGVGGTDEVINFLSMDDAEVEGAKKNLLRTLGVVV
ncbi:hypothetical protein QBC39DRAFT_426099 [Podospora conica]|nr:hypothetical protein QBC39DRAFT_426099 [Schizothecium conicum]